MRLIARLKNETIIILITAVSLPALFLIGSMVDVWLAWCFMMFENAGGALPTPTAWVFSALAGFRMLPQEIMFCFWLYMVMSLVGGLASYESQTRFRQNFLPRFALGWILALTAASSLALAGALPFDPMWVVIDGSTPLLPALHLIVLVEAAGIILIPVIAIRRQKTSQNDS